jgi:hypothetical protein
VWTIICQRFEPLVDLESAKVTRIDLARDFGAALDPSALILGMRFVRRPYGGDCQLYFDHSTQQACSLSFGSRGRRVRLYDKSLQSRGTTSTSDLRWEVQLRSNWLRKYGIEAIRDLTPQALLRLVSEQWEWSQMKKPVVSAPDLFQIINASSGFTERERAGIHWAIQQRQHGCQISTYMKGQLSKFERDHGILTSLAEPKCVRVAPAFSERLDWDSGTVVSIIEEFDLPHTPADPMDEVEGGGPHG